MLSAQIVCRHSGKRKHSCTDERFFFFGEIILRPQLIIRLHFNQAVKDESAWPEAMQDEPLALVAVSELSKLNIRNKDIFQNTA